MTNETILTRDPDDGRRYKVVDLFHWSRIVNVDDETEVHCVKWYGGCPTTKVMFYISDDGEKFITKM